MRLNCLCAFFILVGCCGCATPRSAAYRELYAYLDNPPQTIQEMNQSDYFLVLLVEARHLDYTDNHSFLKTLAKHPSDGSKNGDVGHAWIYLQGVQDGELVYIEGGQSGELGIDEPKYFDGIMNYINYGYANPSSADLCVPRHELNPAKYLWETLHDGFFQWGAGKHYPTYAAKIDLSPEQFERIFAFIKNYNYTEYALIGNQCSTFMAQVAALGGLDLDCEVSMAINACLSVGSENVLLWSDPSYAVLTFSSPDILERSLMDAVRMGEAEYALEWYQKTHPRSFENRACGVFEVLRRFPFRCMRLLAI